MNISILVKTIDDLVARVERLEAIQKANNPVWGSCPPPVVDARGCNPFGVSDGSEESVSSMDESRHSVEL